QPRDRRTKTMPTRSITATTLLGLALAWPIVARPAADDSPHRVESSQTNSSVTDDLDDARADIERLEKQVAADRRHLRATEDALRNARESLRHKEAQALVRTIRQRLESDPEFAEIRDRYEQAARRYADVKRKAKTAT